jgi:hypothetical protein
VLDCDQILSAYLMTFPRRDLRNVGWLDLRPRILQEHRQVAPRRLAASRHPGDAAADRVWAVANDGLAVLGEAKPGEHRNDSVPSVSLGALAAVSLGSLAAPFLAVPDCGEDGDDEQEADDGHRRNDPRGSVWAP